MTVLYKQPGETKILFIEFSDYLDTGDSLSSITSVLESTSTLTIASTSITGTKVQGTYSGGVDGTLYSIVATVVTTNGETLEVDVYLRVLDTSSTTILASYFSLLERVGDYLYGIRSGYTADQTADIEDCIKDGLRDVYAAHRWSFFRPVKTITTTAPYSTGTITIANGVVTLSVDGTFPSWAAVGVLKIDDEYYDVDTLDGDNQITLEDTSVTEADASSYELGRPEYDLDSSVEAIDWVRFYYEAGQSECYPPIEQRHDGEILHRRQNNPYHDRPLFFGIRTVEFDPTVGSRRRLTLYPTPDAAYVLKARMKLRTTMTDETNLYPVGAESLSQVITEACLAAAERNFDEQESIHTKRFQELLPLAIAADLEMTSPTTLGSDDPREEGDDLISRSVRMGDVSIDGTVM
jgi:hypothetical protein